VFLSLCDVPGQKVVTIVQFAALTTVIDLKLAAAKITVKLRRFDEEIHDVIMSLLCFADTLLPINIPYFKSCVKF